MDEFNGKLGSFIEGYNTGSYFAGIGKALKDELQLGEEAILNIILNLIAAEVAENTPATSTSAIGFQAIPTYDIEGDEDSQNTNPRRKAIPKIFKR